MAELVIEQRLRAGLPAEVWASQNTIAEMCNCSRSTVERALEELKRLGRIRDTGERKFGKYRGTVVYELDLTQSDVTQNGSSGEAEDVDLTHSGRDLTHFVDDLTHFEQRPASPVTHKPVVKPVVKPEEASPPAAGLSPSSPGLGGPTPAQLAAERSEDEAELAALERQLETTRHPEQTQHAIDELRERLGRNPASDEWKDWLEHCRSTTGRQVRGSAKARRHFNARRAEGFSLDDLKRATVGAHADDHLRENGYDRPETILQESKVERYIALADQAVKPDPLALIAARDA